MTEIELALNREKTIRQAILVIGPTYPAWRLKKLLGHTNLEKLILTGHISKEYAEELLEPLKLQNRYGKGNIPREIRFCQLEKLVAPEGEFALLFEALDENGDIFPLEKLQPTYLLGQLSETGITSFGVWEIFRKSCKRIFIKTIRQNEEPQILNWTNDEANEGIELSVIFPMYNVSKYLEQCIQSVTCWDAEYVEFLFVNDGSSDNSREIVLEYAKKDKRVRLFDKQNGGCASARQWGVEHAKGRYVGFIDPDDFIDESMFRKLLRAAMVGNYDISYCGYKEYYENTGEIKDVVDVLGWPYNRGTSDQKKIQELIAYCRVAIWRGIYKMDMLKTNNVHFYTDLRRYDDLPFKVETFAVARSVITVDEPLYYYRLARPGQDVAVDDERLYVHFQIFRYLNVSVAGTKNARIIDWLQLCKIQTHRYALEKIKPEFAKEYVKHAREDLKTTGDFWRTLSLAKQMIGKRSTMFYWAIMRKNLYLVKWLKSN